MTKDLSIEEIITAATKSDKKAVKQALEKLKFAIIMSHSSEELNEMIDLPQYHLRLGHKVNSEEYVYTVVRWWGDSFAVYTNQNDANGVISGHGRRTDKDPAIVYMNKPRYTEKKIKEKA